MNNENSIFDLNLSEYLGKINQIYAKRDKNKTLTETLNEIFKASKIVCELINKKLNPNLHLKGILLTKYNDRAILNRDLKKAIEQATEQFNTKVFNTYIRESVAVRESQTNGTCVMLQYPNNNASIDYKLFTKEILKDREVKENE